MIEPGGHVPWPLPTRLPATHHAGISYRPFKAETCSHIR